MWVTCIDVVSLDAFTGKPECLVCEAEVRSYLLLRNLQDPKLLQSTKGWRKEVVDSDMVKFAVRTSFAIYNRNLLIPVVDVQGQHRS